MATILTLSALVGGVFAVENHYANKQETEYAITAVNERIDIIKLEDELVTVKKKMYDLEDRWGKKFKEEHNRYYHTIEELLAFMPKEYKKEYLELKDRKKVLEKEIEDLKPKKPNQKAQNND